MPDIWMDVDANLSAVPVNIFPLIDDGDFKTREVAVAYNATGMDLVWNFTTPAGAFTQTAITPTSGGAYDWTHQGDGMYTLEIPASGGASINNDTEGFGWFTGIATGVLPWRGPIIGFRAAGLNDKLVESVYSATRGLAGTALPEAAADAAGGLPISDAGGLNLDAQIGTDIDAILTDTAVIGAAGAGLSAVPWNAAWDAEVQSEAADALAAYDPPTNAELEARTLIAAGYATAAKQADIEADTQDLQTQIGTDGAGLTNMPWNAAWDAEVQSECTDALAAYDPPTNAELEARTLAAADYATATALATVDGIVDRLDTAMELDGAVYRFTENALEQAPSGSGLDAAGVRTAIGMAAADLDDQLDAIAAAIALIDSSAGSGAIEWIFTVTSGGIAVSGADVWATSTNDINDAVVASGETDGDGKVTFYLDAGTYYIWVQKSGVNFTNPTTQVVS